MPTRSDSLKGSRSGRQARRRWSSGHPACSRSSRRAQDAGMNVGLLKMPPFGDGAWADSLVNTGNGFQVTQWSENKEVAGAFMAFLQQPENLQALYEATGNFPASTNWDSSTVTSPTDQTMLEWLSEKSTAWWAANYTPVDLDVNGDVRRLPEDDGGRDRRSRLGSALPGRDHEVARGESRRRRELPIVAGLADLLGTHSTGRGRRGAVHALSHAPSPDPVAVRGPDDPPRRVRLPVLDRRGRSGSASSGSGRPTSRASSSALTTTATSTTTRCSGARC